MPDNNIVRHYFAEKNNIVKTLQSGRNFVRVEYIIALGRYSYQFTYNYASYSFLEPFHVGG